MQHAPAYACKKTPWPVVFLFLQCNKKTFNGSNILSCYTVVPPFLYNFMVTKW